MDIEESKVKCVSFRLTICWLIETHFIERFYQSTFTVSVGIYPPVRISNDRLYVIVLSCGSRRMDSGALDEDLEHTSIIHESINFCFSINCPLNCIHST
jgi:hypothetical protein